MPATVLSFPDNQFTATGLSNHNVVVTIAPYKLATGTIHAPLCVALGASHEQPQKR